MPTNLEHKSDFKIYPLGDAALVVQFGDTIREDIHAEVRALSACLDKHPFGGMIEYVPAYTTVTIFFDPWILSQHGKHNPYENAVSMVQERMAYVKESREYIPRLVKIPVCYGGEFGPDLQFVASYKGLSVEEVIAIHSGVDYLVYMIGFAPGFPYLGGMDEGIASPRKESPRAIIPAGSVGIAGTQTGIYPIETPGGWQLIGRTPLLLFYPHKNPPTLLKAGDIVRFEPITKDEYLEIKA